MPKVLYGFLTYVLKSLYVFLTNFQGELHY